MPGLEDELGDVVRKARGGLGISLADLSQQVGISEADLKGVEVYTRHPDEAHVRRLAQSLQLRPDQLWDLAEDSWSAPEAPWTIGSGLTIDCLTNHYPEHCYIVVDRDNRCLIVDPGDEPERIIAATVGAGRVAQGILITHNHQDHTGAVVPVQAATKALVYVHEADTSGVSGVPQESVRTFGGDGPLSIGSFEVRVLVTPGHTAGSTTFILEGQGNTAAFCGDTLFAGSVGNARAGYDVILNSVRDKLMRLPEATMLYPGHGPATTVSNERQRNPFL